MQLEEFAAQIRTHRGIVFFTGAGISTESGVPDFRSPGGIWTKYQPVYFQDFVASETARIQHWCLKKATYELYKKVKPNIGHYTIRDFEQRGQLLGLITQNIDGCTSSPEFPKKDWSSSTAQTDRSLVWAAISALNPPAFMKPSAKRSRRPPATPAADF